MTEQELSLEKISIFTSAFTSIFNHTVKWVGLVGLGYITHLVVSDLAGQETMANIVVNFMTDIKVNQWLAYIVGGTGAVYGLKQRKNKNDTIERLSKRKEQLEQMIDPGRKSSTLTPRGETRPEDT